jgi:S1-C subfamily serine protease
MRAGIGLIGLLVGVAVLLWVFSVTELPKARVGKQATEQARQISGRGDDGVAAMDSFKTEPQFNGSRLTGLIVTDVTPGGAMQTYYGLAKDDRVTAIDGMRLNDLANGDDQLAQALVTEAFQKRQTLSIVRNGQTFTVPAPPGTLPPPAGPAAALPAQPAAPAAPAQPPARDGAGALERQLQGIQDAAGAAGRGAE